MLFDNSEAAPIPIARQADGKLHIISKQIYERMVARYR